MNQILNDDMLGEIIKWVLINCTLVCKRWSNIIIKNSIICSTCGKIVKMYGKQIWLSRRNSKMCHTIKYFNEYIYAIYFGIRDIEKFKESFDIFRTSEEIYMTFSFSRLRIKNDKYIFITAYDNVTKITLDGTYFECYYCIKKNVTIKINGQKYCALLNKFNVGTLEMHVNNDHILCIKNKYNKLTMETEYL